MLNCLLIISRIAGVLHSGGSADTNWLGFWWAKCETASKASRANFPCRWIWNCCFLLKRQQKSNFTAASERSLARAFQSRDAESDSCQNQHIRSLRGSSTDLCRILRFFLQDSEVFHPMLGPWCPIIPGRNRKWSCSPAHCHTWNGAHHPAVQWW